MERFAHWAAKNKLFAFILLSVILCSIYTCGLFVLEAPLWLIVLVDVLIVFVNWFFVTTCHNIWIKKALTELDNKCDPYPLLFETEQFLSYKNREPEKQQLLINHCAALDSVGEYQKVYDILSSMNIDKYAGTLPIVKTVYYHNLMSVCWALDKNEDADFLYSKVMMLYHDNKNTKQKAFLRPVIMTAEAQYYFRRQGYDRAIELLDSVELTTLRSRVHNAMNYAKVYAELNETEKAREKLAYVINNGNRLHIVKEAQNLLEKLS